MPKFQSRIPPDFPNEHRLGDALLFRELLGNPGRSTFARYLSLGLIPPPDAKLGALNRWKEITIAQALATLPVEKARRGASNGDRSRPRADAA
jgi:hypothetical protein